MATQSDFEAMLAEGKPNSLGRTVEVVEIVLADKARFDDLYQCYFSENEWVRLRVSNAMKRICKVHPEWLVPYLDKFLNDISRIDQASTQWTLATLYLWLKDAMTKAQKQQATEHLKQLLATHDDWIVQNTTIETLGHWAKTDGALRTWLVPKLERCAKSPRKSVARRAEKMLEELQNYA